MTVAAGLGLGLLPVLLFLGGLVVLDSYKLVTRRAVLASVAWGAIAAGLAFAANVALLERAGLDPAPLKRWVAPALEEVLKAAPVLILLRRGRIGFMVDAGIHGFAAGAGFALVENLYYAWALGNFAPVLWLVRGLGTAILHGSTTAVVAIVAKDLSDRRAARIRAAAAPGLAVAFAVHSAFNHLVLDPLVSTAIIVLTMPLLLLAVFERSERATRDWLGSGMDRDLELAELISTGQIRDTRIGRYLESLRDRFPGPVVADMLCLLQIHVELAIRAKGLLLAREAGLEVPVDERVHANFDEMGYLERSIGPTGLLAMQPFFRRSRRDLWQLHVLGAGGRPRRHAGGA